MILSPHLDDAVLSCWDALEGSEKAGVVNVFAGVPPAGASAGWWDISNGGEDSSQTMLLRMEEDRAALALAGREALNLDFLDSQYRQLSQPLEPLLDALCAVLPGGAEVWAPAAIPPPLENPHTRDGRTPHPDHLLVRSAALSLWARGYRIALYADLPHASAGGWPEWVTGGATGDQGRVGNLWRNCLAGVGIDDNQGAKVTRLPGEAFERKVRAARHYASQVQALERGFGRLDDPALLGYEVVWRLPEPHRSR
jgi:LmbE family N-acetylglucosaminyl deacetylase